MKIIACRLILLSMTTLIACTAPPPAVLDSSYDSAIERSTRALDQPKKRESLREIFLESTQSWKSQPNYTEVRKRIESLRVTKRQFRLEVGNVNAGGYGVIWIAETDSEIVVFSNMFSSRRLISGKLSQAKWSQFSHLLAEHERSTTCKSDLSVDDGFTYFGTIALNQHIEAFIVYGFIPFPPTPLAKGLYTQLTPCSDIILAAYSLAKSIQR